MKAALVIFDNMTTLDFVGFYDPLTRLHSMKIMPSLQWNVCAMRPTIRDDRGLTIHADWFEKPLTEFDVVFIPGGFGTRTLQHDAAFLKWISSAANAKIRISVCTGALILGAAGYLQGLRATTHPSALKELEPYCKTVVSERIVDEDHAITAGGVTAAIDLGLHVVQRIAGKEAKQRIASQMDYPYNT